MNRKCPRAFTSAWGSWATLRASKVFRHFLWSDYTGRGFTSDGLGMPEFIAGLVVLVWAVSLSGCVRSPVWGAASVLVLTVAEALVISAPGVSLGIWWYPPDLVMIGLLGSGMLRMLFGRGNRAPVAWYVLGALIGVGFIVGLAMYGSAAGVDFRRFFYFWSGTLYFASFRYSVNEVQGIGRAWLIACYFLLAIVAFRWVAEFQGLAIAKTWIDADPTGVRFRVINAAQAYVLGVGLLVVFYRLLGGTLKSWGRVLAAMLAVAVIGLQHRSVWVATLGALLALFVMPGVRWRRRLGSVVSVMVPGLLVIGPLLIIGFGQELFTSVGTSAGKAASVTTGTFIARVVGWKVLLADWTDAGLVGQVLGQPFGGSYGGAERSPHNFYLQTLVRTGVVGLGALVWTYAAGSRGLFGRARTEPLAGLLLAAMVSQLLFYIPYAPSYEHGILLGIALSVARRGAWVNARAQQGGGGVAGGLEVSKRTLSAAR